MISSVQGTADAATSKPFDVVVVGAGTVGLYVARMLNQHGVHLALVDAGASEPDWVTRQSNDTFHRGVTEGWRWGFGGTTQIWGGQLWPWRADEFVGWRHANIPPWPLAPVSSDEYARTIENLGLPSAHLAVHGGVLGTRASYIASPEFRQRFSTWIPYTQRNFSKNRALRLTKVTRFRDRTVSRLDVNRDRVSVTTRAALSGSSGVIEGRMVVLAAGVLGNTRIISASNWLSSLPATGQGFMDHVSRRVAWADICNSRDFVRWASQRWHRGVLSSPRIVPSRALIQELETNPFYAHWEFSSDDGHPYARARRAYRNLQHGQPPDLGGHELVSIARYGVNALRDRALHQRRSIPRPIQAYLRVDVEQSPLASRQVLWDLSGEKPVVNLRWQISEAECATFDLAQAALVSAIDPAILRRGTVPDYQPNGRYLPPDGRNGSGKLAHHLCGRSRHGHTWT